MGDKIGGYLPVSDFLNTAVKGLGQGKCMKKLFTL